MYMRCDCCEKRGQCEPTGEIVHRDTERLYIEMYKCGQCGQTFKAYMHLKHEFMRIPPDQLERVQSDTYQWLLDISTKGFRERVKEAMKAQKISQAEMARRAGCSSSNISGIMRGGHMGKYVWRVARDILNNHHMKNKEDVVENGNRESS